jgi:hypothetical protein
MHFDFAGPSVIVAFRSDSVELLSGLGVHKLRILGTTKGREVGAVAMFEIPALNLSTLGHPSHWLASASVATPVMNGHEYGFEVGFPLTDNQLRLLDDLRAGNDLLLNLTGTAHMPGRPEASTANGGDHVRIPASSWTTLIERAQLGVSSTVSISLVGADDAHREAAERLREARQCLNNGDCDSAILKARQAMERAGEIAGWRAGEGRDHKQWSQAERWFSIMQAAKTQAAGAIHDDPLTKTFVYSRAEAEALIGIAAALLKAAPAPLT